MKKKSIPRSQLLRYLIQAAFLLFILVSAVRHNISEELAPSTDAYCPFGGVETLWRWITTGYFVSKTHGSNLVLALGLLASVLLVGGTFCGWICPFGALQDALNWVRGKLKLPMLRVPDRVDRVLMYGRYLVLAGILYATISTAKLWFADFDPYRTIFSLGWIFEFNLAEHWPAYLTALLVLVGALFIPRFWCRYMCPLGGLISLVQRISLFRIRRDANICINCGKCTKACPVRLPVATSTNVTSRCIGCLKCIEACPKAGALDVSFILPSAAPAQTREAPHT
jgi:polyferredoxin